VPRSPRSGSPSPAPNAAAPDPLVGFAPATRDWFRSAFAEPTPAQAGAWPVISHGRHTLVCAPTGSGKTLAAFLWCLDRLAVEPPPADPRARLRVLYVSPLKALVHDVERNLRAPLTGIRITSEARGEPAPDIRVAMRTGDTPAEERRTFGRRPPDILVTTPESLYLLLTSAAREALRSVRWVIVDEIHALAATKRGAHLALSLERLENLTASAPQRIGLSATQRPLEAVAAFLGGREPVEGVAGDRRGAAHAIDVPGGGELPLRPVEIVDAGIRKQLDLQVVVPVEDMSRLGEAIPLQEASGGPAAGPVERFSIWPAIHPRIVELIRAHHSTIVFVNSRGLAERLARRINELAGEELVRAHHGSLAREQRVLVEEALKEGRLAGIVATSSLELGIDMGAVDLVVQVESPGSVSRGLQRIGRAGHHVDEPSHGVIFPKYRGDLLECAVVTQAMHEGAIESTVVPHNPLDVLAQQLVAACTERSWPVDELYALVRRAENYATLARPSFEGVLAMLAGQYPSDEFAELRPRIVWDRVAGTVRGRSESRVVAVLSGGTIPDRGLFGVYLDGGPGEGDRRERAVETAERPAGGSGGRVRGGRRVGELDEEMVYETRAGEVILLGASAWRITQITADRVLVEPAPGQPGKVPFWKGDGPGRPVELGRQLGSFTRRLHEESRGARGRGRALARLAAENDLDYPAGENLIAYIDDQADASAVPTDRTIVIERFRDELGDWRVCVLTPFGGRVHAPWALAIEARLRESLGVDVRALWSDDGVVLRIPATEDPSGMGPGSTGGGEDIAGASGVERIHAAIFRGPDDTEEAVVAALGSSALFAARFRENAARALLLPRMRAGRRRPLWQMRQRSAQLLEVAARYGSFPIVLETFRECLRDVFDMPALRELLSSVERREIEVRHVETSHASPFASSLLFDYVAAYMYEGDAPLVDRRAQALALDRDLLRELLGVEELRELLDRDALAELELELQGLSGDRGPRSADQLHDALRRLGDLGDAEIAARVPGNSEAERRAAASEWIGALQAEHRVVRVRIAGEARWIAAEDAGRYRDALGVALPAGTPGAFLDRVPDPLAGLLARWARTHGPFLPAGPADRWAVPALPVERALEGLLAAGAILRGEFRPGGWEREWCDPEVLRALRRRSLARLRHEIEPVEPAAYARFLPAWQGVGRAGAGGLDRLVDVVAQLEGLPLPASVLERDVLPARVPGYSPRLLDELGAAGEVAWVGHGRLGPDDGRIALYRPDRLGLLLDRAAPSAPVGDGEAGAALKAGTSAAAGGAATGGNHDRAPSAAGGAPPADPEDAAWLRDAMVAGLRRHGASFYRDLLAAAHEAALSRGEPAPGERVVLDALWDLAWEGTVTNDTFAALRALRWRRPSRAGPRRGIRGVPPEATGRWSLVSDAFPAPEQASPTARLHAHALALLERQGVVTRDGVMAEPVPGGFAAVYPILRELEERGRVRRGYFVERLGAAQFALPGAVERLRAARRGPGEEPDPGAVLVMAAVDPAQPYGAALPWPRRGTDDRRALARAAGAYVVLLDGEPAAFLERGGHSLRRLPAFERPGAGLASLRALASLVADGRLRALQLSRVDGTPADDPDLRDLLQAAGFRRGYRGWQVVAGAGGA
jgi:ATP-dependent Lhr-like helicase